MEIYIPREGWYQINQFNHGDLYVKRYQPSLDIYISMVKPVNGILTLS
jgi:hypothetical protein